MSAFKQLKPVQTNQPLTSFSVIHSIYFNGLAAKFDLKPTTLTVLIGLASHFNPNKSIVFPHQSYLAEKLNISERSVIRSIAELIEKNLILKSKKQSGNVYGFTAIFFEALELSSGKCQIDRSGSDNLAVAYRTNKDNKEKKNISVKTLSTSPAQTEMNELLKQLEELNVKGPGWLIRRHGADKIQTLLEQVNNRADVHNKGAYLRALLENPQVKPVQVDNSVEKTKQYLKEQNSVKCGSPLDFTEEQAREWYGCLMPELRKGYFALKVKEKWGWSD